MKGIALLLALLALAGCAAKPSEAPPPKPTYTQITQDEAREKMAAADGHILLDVRRIDEFDAGHIPGAVCLPNEEIGTEPPELLPDRAQVILIYCRSGRRSKEAAQKLADMGYTNVYEFGGIIDWTGEVTANEPPKPAELTFDTFAGGGPEFRAVIGAPDVLSASYTSVANAPEPMPGMGCTVTYTFTGLKPGTTTLTIEERSPIADNLDHVYRATVDEGLNVTLEHIETRDLYEQLNGGGV